MELRALLVLIASCFPLAAQHYKIPAYELSGGFTTIQRDHSQSYYGVNGAWTANINRRVGLAVEAGALFGDREVFGLDNVPEGVDTSPDRNLFTLLVGPRVRILTTDRYTVALHALGGYTRASSEGLLLDDDGVAMMSPRFVDHHGAASLGGTFDVRISNRVAWRLQPDWFWASGAENGWFRFSTGLVFRFGSR